MVTQVKALLVVYDNRGYLPYFPMGIGYIATALSEVGVDVEIWNQDIHHYPDSQLTLHLDANRYDMVGISLCGGYYQYNKLKRLSHAVNQSKNRSSFRYILGGHLPSSDPEYFLKLSGADCIVIGEGEATIQLLASLEFVPSSEVNGIAWLNNGQFILNPRMPLFDLTGINRMPKYELFPMDVYRLVRMPNCDKTDFVMPILSGRGCKFRCNFCYRLDTGFRPRTAEDILAEIRYLQTNYGITYFSFGDELLMSSVKRTIDLCQSFIDSGLCFKWDCNGRLNYAKPEVLSLMKQSGCVFINYGIEAFDDQVLKNMNKSLTCDQIITGIEATLSAGISPGFNIIWGNIGDNAETLQKGVDFLLKYDDGSQLRTIRPVTPYPGSPLFDWCVDKGLVKDVADFYENKHKNSDLFSLDIMGIGLDVSHSLLMDANRKLLANYFHHKRQQTETDLINLYQLNNTNFRGWRQL